MSAQKQLRPSYRKVTLLRFFVVALLIGWYGYFLASPVIFSTGDLGRHLKNGEIILSSLDDPDTLKNILHTNFYSAGFADFPFINHHWGSGVVLYAVFSLAGFKGLTVFYTLLSLATLGLFFAAASSRAGWKIAAPLAFFLIPLIAERVFVRPEGFSYFFAALFYFLLSQYSRGRVNFRSLLLALPLLQIVWANLHIYFFLGPVIVAVFFLEKTWRSEEKRREAKRGALLFFLTVIGGLVTPFGLTGLLYPFRIFENYGIGVTENQPGWLLVKQGFKLDNYPIYKITLFALVVGAIVQLARQWRQFPLAPAGLALLFGLVSWVAVRNYTLFGFLALPALSILAATFLDTGQLAAKTKKWLGILSLLTIIFLTAALNYSRVAIHAREYGLGIVSNTPNAAKFFLDNEIQGPIFNDFDIGGYLIYYLFPAERPLVDNRPEAYPASAFENIFVPLHAVPEAWAKSADNFNAIVLSLDDRASWTLPFIVARLNDPAWAPVFADKSVILFLKRNEKNAAVIAEFEMPPSAFGLQRVE